MRIPTGVNCPTCAKTFVDKYYKLTFNKADSTFSYQRFDENNLQDTSATYQLNSTLNVIEQ